MTLSEFLRPGCALFLDFDGTLVDIAAHPEAVIVPPGLRETLAQVQALLEGAVAVVSGRPIAQIDCFLAPLVLSVSGVHGAERRRGDGSLEWEAIEPMDRIEAAATALAREHAGLRVERKRGSVALHYRQAPQLRALCQSTMQAAVEQSAGLTLLCGKMVVEAKPSRTSKRLAIEAFLAEAPFAGRPSAFAGDDLTDEGGFALVQQLGGLGVKVGEGVSCARERTASPATLRDALAQAVARHAGNPR